MVRGEHTDTGQQLDVRKDMVRECGQDNVAKPQFGLQGRYCVPAQQLQKEFDRPRRGLHQGRKV